MRKFFNGLVLGIIVGVGGVLFYESTNPMANVEAVKPRADLQSGSAAKTLPQAAERAAQLLAARLDALELDAEGIRKELAATGQVARRRARDLGDAVADVAADTPITVAVKAKLAADPELSAWDISVHTTAGRVMLSGSVASVRLIGKAMELALQTPGVHAVVSTLTVKQAATGAPPS